ncbi:PAS domain S-box protein [Sandaracinobacter neustonicus]|uniref:histidine kinase n=1 Tax=Sandaracinobacter neustonicus TaxID=1715348 RepID=A0A501XTR6_9SPHN|nr:PAS domain-containing protein [Sandaracinobacter neustonicus]TPE63960.1 PAS domain S-box protein [Sandaracinobacter neustonicus]
MPISADNTKGPEDGVMPFVALPDPTFQLTDCLPQIVWSAKPDGGRDYFNAQWYAFVGMPPGSTDGNAWQELVHPDDLERLRARWRHSLDSGELYEIEYRLRHHSGFYRWTLARGLPVRDFDGAITRWVGTCTDIEDRKRLEQDYQLLSGELKHRIDNIFTVVGSLLALSARGRPEVSGFAQDLSARLRALRSAQELLRVPDAQAAAGAPLSLHRLLHLIFAPYPAFQEERIRVSGDDVALAEVAATPLALLFHELTTNAVKYGALSADGRVLLECRVQGPQLGILWTETGGPPLPGPPTRTGFGTDLSTLSVRRQLGGELERFWKPEGLVLKAVIPLSRLT